MKTQEEVIKPVKEGNPLHYKKSGKFTFEISKKEKEIVTSFGDEVETKNTAKIGDYILTGASGENYILKPDNFKKRYKIIKNEDDQYFGIAIAIGECYAIVYKGESFKFMAPWNEEMICNYGDYLCSPDDTFSEAYRIEQDTFEKTYKLIEEVSVDDLGHKIPDTYNTK